MARLYRLLWVMNATILFFTACNMQTVRVETVISPSTTYRDVLGKSLTDQKVADFITSNNCSVADEFQLCKEIGIALRVNSNHMVETVYLYLNNVQVFEPYRGELPYGLKFYDIMEAVEYKLKKQGVGQDGLPDQGGTPDHLHYWATYQQAGMTIIYNSPSSEDEDASIYAILLSR